MSVDGTCSRGAHLTVVNVYMCNVLNMSKNNSFSILDTVENKNLKRGSLMNAVKEENHFGLQLNQKQRARQLLVKQHFIFNNDHAKSDA